MTAFGNWWMAKQEALWGERLAVSLTANRTQSTNRAAGHLLFLCQTFHIYPSREEF